MRHRNFYVMSKPRYVPLDQYFLTLNNITHTTEVNFFSEKNRLLGLQKYSELEESHLNNEDLNFVFISVNNMNKLKQAYPNYFMDTQALIKILSQIVLKEF